MRRRSTYRRQRREKMVGENLPESSMEAVFELRSEPLDAKDSKKASRHRRNPALKERISGFV